MKTIRSLLLVAVLGVGVMGIAACNPAPIKCKTTMHKYDHKTGPITWFTLFNEMRFCYDGTKATKIEWEDNRTSSPTLPYGRGGVKTVKLVETFDGNQRRARNQSRHSITCVKVVNGFDVTMRQLGYGSGTVTKWRSSIDSSTDC